MAQKLYCKEIGGTLRKVFGITEERDLRGSVIYRAYETLDNRYPVLSDSYISAQMGSLAGYILSTSGCSSEFENLEKTIMSVERKDGQLVVTIQRGLSEGELRALAGDIASRKG